MFYDKEYIGKKFKEYRRKLDYTQEELSEKVGIAEKHYGKLERGAFIPSLETFFKLIEVLNIPMSEFGIKNNANKNNLRDDLIREIYLSNEAEMNLYLSLIQFIKSYNTKFKRK